MAGYQYHGTETLQAALERKQRLQNELDEARQLHKEALRIQKENQRIEHQIIQTQNRTAALIEKPHQTLRPIQALPEPRYGGHQGLLAAAAEASDYDRRRRIAA
ncbi:hypothetical protein [Paenarthrobacter sp. NPDC018779]|uniref:hypothetical protein n=1 Tax=Paenarthrobacter sp. NPDC018779 TaxID=3364375 RepID=UPI0037C8C535